MRLILLYFLLLALSSCSNRTDIVFSSSDDLHSLILYEQNKEFEMLYNGFNTVEGNYSFKNDTIYLTYTKNETAGTNPEKPASQILTNLIWVDRAHKRIQSLNGMQFCGRIGRNELK